MNKWLEKSIELANQENYLDLLIEIYPMPVNSIRKIDTTTKDCIKKYFDERNDIELIQILLKQEVFPIKDSYVVFLKRDKNAVYKNPKIVSRLARMLYSMGLDEIYAKISLPKETNRQIGPLFTNWINSGALGCKITRNHSEMLSSTENIVLNSNDKDRSIFAKEHLGYIHAKGLDFVGKFNNKSQIFECK